MTSYAGANGTQIVLSSRHIFEIVQTIVHVIAVDMVYFKIAWSKECGGNKTMNLV